ncbi:MAG TPA: IS200/IS605 family transposase [Ktedonobacterales bacterium]|jgi:putative transposase|nr:IS200/IS605 family transposase [Ktedonobacterales bacterium]
MRRPKIGVFLHLVWATWDRLPLLTPDAEHQAYRVIGAKCRELGVEMIAIGGVTDHVHLLVRIPSTLTIADLVKHVKGASAHLLSAQAEERHQFFKWQGAYGAFSVSPRDLRAVADYIAHQKEHHAAGSLIAEWETSGDDGD